MPIANEILFQRVAILLLTRGWATLKELVKLLEQMTYVQVPEEEVRIALERLNRLNCLTKDTRENYTFYSIPGIAEYREILLKELLTSHNYIANCAERAHAQTKAQEPIRGEPSEFSR
jgi:hypothetical protein